ncbi:MAG: 2-oxo-4-hydroxy-4-carboxy-5-ureidoimidazoline decarboxylase [Candidatus Rokuibacteriota bacterium]|nr:MAG: 2-oxo-4-hydroxy-4-carboxy-5-ureidoimidazoline decarboxylase [Candidatus Rokubacteria bacterium]
MTAATLTLDTLNRVSREEFEQALGAVFEHSPWIAGRAGEARPFASVEALHAGMIAVVRRASRQEQLALLRAHPDLAGRAARAGALSDASSAEQSSAGLDRLSDEEYERFGRLNAAYREKFGFPFIIAVRRHDKTGILDTFQTRLRNTPDQEVETALAEVAAITRLRLARLVKER